MRPTRIWAISAAVSVFVHVAVFASAAAARLGPRGAAADAFTVRDVRFLVEAIRETAAGPASARTEAATARPASGPRGMSVALPAASSAVAPPSRTPPRPADPEKPGPPPALPAASGAPGGGDEPKAVMDGVVAEPRVDVESLPAAPKDGGLPPQVRFYIQHVHNRIARAVRFPDVPGIRDLRGLVTIRLTVDRRGTIREMRYVHHADHPPLDLVAEQALRGAAPYPSLEGVIDLDEISLLIPFRF